MDREATWELESSTECGVSDRLPVVYEPPSAHRELAERTLARDTVAYLTAKRRRLTPASERGYRAILDELVAAFPGARLADFEPPAGSLLLEGWLNVRWGELAPRTYNKSHSVISDFFEWFVARMLLQRNPMTTVDRAKARPVHRTTFSTDQRGLILAASPDPRDQIALRLLLDYGIRKGALRGIRFEHFNPDSHRLTVFTKGETIHVLPVVDEVVWQLLAQLDEPAHHYLLPKQLTRKRTPPQRKALTRLAASLTDARGALEHAAQDEQCVRELAQVLTSIDDGRRWLDLATAAASTQVRQDPAEAIGEHGAHLWWYRCLQRAGIVEPGATSGQRMHKARHTAGQKVLDATGNLKAAQALLGHSTIGTTGDVYTDWDEARLEDTMRDVGAAKGRA